MMVFRRGKFIERFGACGRVLAVSLGLTVGGLTVGAEAMTLQDAVKGAVESNPSVQASISQFKSSYESADGVYAAFRPQVSLTANADYARYNTPSSRARHGGTATGKWADVTQGNVVLSVSKILWDGGRVGGQHQAAQQTAEGLRYTASATQLLIAQEAMQAYVDVYKQRQLVGILEAKLAEHRRVTALAEQQAATGEGAAADVDTINSRTNAVETFLTLQRQQLRDAESRFVLHIGQAPAELQDPPMPNGTNGLSLEELIVLAYDEQPAVQASLATIRASEATLASAVPSYYPTVSVDLSADREFNSGEFRVSDTDAGDEKTTYTASLLLSMSLYDGGAARAAQRAAVEAVMAATRQEGATRRQVENQVRVAHSAMLSARQQTPLFQDNLETQKKNYENALAFFENDEQDLLGVLDARSFVFDAEFQLKNAYYDEISARYRVLAAVGRLLDYMDIQVDQIDMAGGSE